MFIVFLRFSKNKASAGAFMEGHKDWIQRGLNDAVFLVVGGLQSGEGGCIVAHDIGLDDLRERVKEDPFVREDVVRYEIHEVEPSRVDSRLGFLLQE